MRTVEEYIQIGLEEGATPALLGHRPDDPELAHGHFITPTIFTDVRNDDAHRAGRNLRAGAVRHQVRQRRRSDQQANDTIYGLAAGVWSSDVERAVKVANRIRAGTIWINDYHLISAEAPFGGYKQSGIGRELGTWGLEEYTEVKHIHVNLSPDRKARFWFDILLPQGEEN